MLDRVNEGVSFLAPYGLFFLLGLSSPAFAADPPDSIDRVQAQDFEPMAEEPSDEDLDPYLETFVGLEEDAAIAYAARMFTAKPAWIPYLVEEFALGYPWRTGDLFDAAEREAQSQDLPILAELREDFEVRLERVFLFLDAPEDALPPPLEYFDLPLLEVLAQDEVYLGDEELAFPETTEELVAQLQTLEGPARVRRLGDYLIAHPDQIVAVTDEVTELDPLRAEESFAVALEVGPDVEAELYARAEAFSQRLERLAGAIEAVAQGNQAGLSALGAEDQALVLAMAQDQALDAELEEAMPPDPKAEAAEVLPDQEEPPRAGGRN